MSPAGRGARASDGKAHSRCRFFLASLKSAMIKGCREPPYPSILTDATMEKLALAKFVAQESKCEVRSWGGRGRGLGLGRVLALSGPPGAGRDLTAVYCPPTPAPGSRSDRALLWAGALGGPH